MFGGGTANPYDEIVGKTTDENLTSENWELILNLCDKVVDEGEEGARNVIAAILKRLSHRNPNVQLYALSLAESLSKNCGAVMNREIASRAFTQALEKLATDRNTHDKVKKRVLTLVLMWTADFENDTSLGVMEDCFNTLKGKGLKFETPQEPVPPTVDDEIRRKEEEELQRVLELSMQDTGRRNQWAQYTMAGSSLPQPGGASSQVPAAPAPITATSSTASTAASTNAPQRSASLSYRPSPAGPTYQGGYVPAKTPSPVHAQQQLPPQAHRQPQSPQQQPHRQSSLRQPPRKTSYSQPQPQQHHDSIYQQPQTSSTSITIGAASPTSSTGSLAVSTVPSSATSATSTGTGSTTTTNATIVTRVRALHTFEPTEPGELPFEKGDIIRVVDRGYQDWWRGQLKGRTGIFPVNYVEPMPEPTAADVAKEAEQEASVFSQAVNVEKLLNMLRGFDPASDNLADNEEIQELYRSCMALRPKIVKLIDKYSQKRADLVSMNETFIRARAIFDRMMEESLARHTGIYDHGYGYDPRTRIGSPPVAGGPQAYGWNPSLYDQPGYNLYPAAAGAQHPQHHAQHDAPYPSATPAPGLGINLPPQSGPTPAPGAQAYAQPEYGYPAQAQGAYGYPGNVPVPYAAQGSTPAPYAAQPGVQAQVHPQGQTPVQSQAQVQAQPPQQQPQQPTQAAAPGYHDYPAQQQPTQAAAPGYHDYHAQQQQQQPLGYSPQAQAQVQPQPQSQQPHIQVQAQPQQVPTQAYPTEYQQPQQQPQPLQQQHPQQQQPSPGFQNQVLPQPQQQPQQAQVQHQGQPLSMDTVATAQSEQVQPAHVQPAQAQAVQGVAAQIQQMQAQAQVSQAQTDAAAQSPQRQEDGPPYVFNPDTTYSDPNVRAWAQYYAQGGKDPAGAVYFYSVPGVTDDVAPQVQQSSQGRQQAQGQGQTAKTQQGQIVYEQSQGNAGSTTSLGVGATGVNSNTGATSPSSSPNKTYPERYPSPTGSQQTHAHAHQQQPVPHSSYSSLAHAGGYTGTASAGQATHGVSQSPQGGHGQQPSWVLPRRTSGGSPPKSPTQQASVPSAMVGGYTTMDPAAGAGAVTQPYHALPNQLAGMTILE